MKRIQLLCLFAAMAGLLLTGCRVRLLKDPDAADQILFSTQSTDSVETTIPAEETEAPEPMLPTETEVAQSTEPVSALEEETEAAPPAEPQAFAQPQTGSQTPSGAKSSSAEPGKASEFGSKPAIPPSTSEETETTQPEPQDALTVTVTFDPNGGDSPVYLSSVRPGELYGALPEATRHSHIFNGWWTMPEDGERIFPDSVVALEEDHTLYAHWSKACGFQILFDANGGRIKTKDARMELMPGEVFGKLPTPQREGYRFAGWFTDPIAGSETTEATVFAGTGDLTLYAHWKYDPLAYWSFVLQNKTQQVYLCQQVSIYFETTEDHVTRTQVDLISDTGSLNIAQYLSDPVTTDDWVLAKNPPVIIKCVSSMAQSEQIRASMAERFPGRTLFLVTQAALDDSNHGLYARLFLSKILYADFFADVDLAQAAQELNVADVPIRDFDLP